MKKIYGLIFGMAMMIGCSQDMLQGHKHYDEMRYGANPWLANRVSGADGNGSKVNYGLPISDGTNGTPRTGYETRPVNIVMHYIIKY